MAGRGWKNKPTASVTPMAKLTQGGFRSSQSSLSSAKTKTPLHRNMQSYAENLPSFLRFAGKAIKHRLIFSPSMDPDAKRKRLWAQVFSEHVQRRADKRKVGRWHGPEAKSVTQRDLACR